MCVCVCVRACVRACMRASTCVYMLSAKCLCIILPCVQSPFYGDDEEELFHSICNEQVVYPRWFPPEALNFVDKVSHSCAVAINHFMICGTIHSYSRGSQQRDWGALRTKRKSGSIHFLVTLTGISCMLNKSNLLSSPML